MTKVLILDLETTGLDANVEAITEIGLLSFEFDGEKCDMGETYSALEDPKRPLADFIKKLTGLNDEMLKGKKVDWLRVKDMISAADYVVAHNAQFDRAFIEKRPELSGVSIKWACSKRHIDWKGHGFRTTSLNYLAADMGFINPFAHRAVFDCATTYRVIQGYVGEMLARSQEKEHKVEAFGAPFNKKDVLKEAGYRWDAVGKVWNKVVADSGLEATREFLRKKVYCGGLDSHRETEL